MTPPVLSRRAIIFELASLLMRRPPDRPVAVVIPVYKEHFSKYEEMSFTQAARVLGSHPFVLIAPEGLRVNHPDAAADIRIEYFPSSYFTGVPAYSQLLLAPEFYRRLLAYRSILIFQLDAFVFRDELLYWCSQRFDYIGAPWLGDWVNDWGPRFSWRRRLTRRPPLPYKDRVGNGGFSLRHVRKSLLIILFARLRRFTWTMNEDLYWSYFVTSYVPFFKVADLQSALRFSFDMSPEECYALNGNALPFGCHAWDKEPNIAFWRPFFQEYGYQI